MYKAIGGRKFVLMMTMLVVGILVDLYTQRGLSDNFMELMVYLSAIYITGNSVGAVSDAIKVKTKAKAKITYNNSTDNVVKSIDELKSYQDAILQSVQINSQALTEIISKFKG